MKLDSIDHIVLRVSDLDQMLQFYTAVLGCRIERRRDDLGLVHLRAGDAFIDLVSVAGPLGVLGGSGPGKDGHNIDHFCLRVTDFDPEGIRAELISQGVKIGEVASRFGARGESLSIYIRDPEGNGIELR